MGFDWKHPDYAPVWKLRLKNLDYIQEHPECLPELFAFYRLKPWQFIDDWGVTFDPRNVERGLPALVPFLLFPRQIEWCQWVFRKWQEQRPGLCEKARDMGVSWLAMAFASTLCMFYDGVVIGAGSRKAEYVDEPGTMKPLLPKARKFLEHVPHEFLGDWQAWRDAPTMRINFPKTGSIITGEAGDEIGRGDRASIYLVDEAAHLKRPELVDAALSQTTNCRIDMSSVRGMGNPFAQKRWGGKVEVFLFDWRAQPLDAKIMTPDGWRFMRDVAVGSHVIGNDGRAVRVIGVYPQGKKEVYRVSFSDGSSTESCADHLWEVIPNGNQREGRRHLRRVMPLREIMKDYVRVDSRGFRRHLYQIPLVSPVSCYPTVDLPLDSYVVGCLLGDGSLPKKSSSAIEISIGPDREIIDLINLRLPAGCDAKQVDEIKYRISANGAYRGGDRGRGCHNPVNEAVRDLGLSGRQSHDKFIPEIYMMASVDQRIDLLCGLMDTDGHVAKSDKGIARFSTVSKQLSLDVVRLAQSLGGTAKVRKPKIIPIAVFGNRTCERKQSYIVDVKLPTGIIPFKMSRKANSFQPSSRYQARRSLIGIELVGTKECQCIKVESDAGLYLTDNFIVTHNSDPRKDDAWYAKQCEDLDPVVVAQEIDRDYSASVRGVVIPGAWVRAAIDAKQKLGIAPSGEWLLAYDVADEGEDKNAVVGGQGTEISIAEEWSGKGSDTFASTEQVFEICDEHGVRRFLYDSDGIGAGVRGDARIINDRRAASGQRVLPALGFRGSGAIVNPEGIVEGTIGRDGDAGRKNEDFFANAKAQGWWALRTRFQKTWRWVEKGIVCAPDDIISISSKMPNYLKLVAELPQVTYQANGAGKIVIKKMPNGMKSPNLGDGTMMRFAPSGPPPLNVTGQVLAGLRGAGRRR